MEAPAPPLIVLDTSVVVSALVGPAGSPHGRLIDKVASGDVLLARSVDFLREPSRVVGYPDIEARIVSGATGPSGTASSSASWAICDPPRDTTGRALAIPRMGGCSTWPGRFKRTASSPGTRT